MSDREKREIRIHNKSDKPDNIVKTVQAVV